MDVRKEEFPVVVQAFDNDKNQELFVAEQVVNSQTEIDSFTSRYSGKVIKARRLTGDELKRQDNTGTTRKKKGAPVGLIVVLLLIALVIVGFATGWIQQTFNIRL